VHLVGEEAGIQDKGLFVFFCVFLGLSVRCLVNINITLFAKKKQEPQPYYAALVPHDVICIDLAMVKTTIEDLLGFVLALCDQQD
jgi:hypothetical protein